MDDDNHDGKDEMNLAVLRNLGRSADDGHGKFQGKARSAPKVDDPLVGKKGVAAAKAANGKRVLSQRAEREEQQASA